MFVFIILTKYMNQNKALSFWQIRILDLFKCLEATTLPISTFSFNLKLSDPIEKFFEEDSDFFIKLPTPDPYTQQKSQTSLLFLYLSFGPVFISSN